MDGRYTILGSIAKGGMATVYLGRVTGSAGFSRLVAIKRLHPDLAAEKEFVGMLVDEARLASQIRHTNVVDTLDLVVSDGAFSLVLQYVEGDSLSRLLGRAEELGEPVPPPIALAILYGVLRGLDAAHEARNEDGQPLGVVHRDVSPQNVLLGVDGIPRIIDFGVAKAIGRFESTRPGEVRGKFSYMAPEQMQARPVTRQVDVYAAGVLLWELLASKKLFDAEDPRVICADVLRGDIKAPSTVNADIEPALDAIVLRATARELGERYLTAREVLGDLEKLERASDDEVGAWVRRLSARQLADRQRLIQDAVPASDGRPLEDLMADLSRRAVPGVGSSPELRAIDANDTILASTAGTGLELVAPAQGLGGATPARRRNVFGPALALVGFLVVVGLFLRFRTGAEAGKSTVAFPSAVFDPALEVAPLPSPPASTAPIASTAPEDPELVELPATPGSSPATSGKPPRRAPRPRPSADPRAFRNYR
jgi:serine/threonine-protein kinase